MFPSKLRIVTVVLWAACAAALALAPGTPAVAGKDAAGPREDRDSLRRTWKMTSVEWQGKQAPAAAAFTRGEWEVTADRLTFRLGTNSVAWTYTRDGAKMPGEIDLTATSGPEKGQMLRGIYKLEGDRLRICYGKERPTTFAAGPGQDQVLMVLRREPTGKGEDQLEKK
jgi:uncharacterized protein (TIGR03067 family)